MVWINVVSIEIFAEAVHSEMTVVDAIDVDHGYDHEDEHSFQEVASNIFGID